MSKNNFDDEPLPPAVEYSADDEGVIPTDEYVDRVSSIAAVTERLDGSGLFPADSMPVKYDYAGVGPSHRVLGVIGDVDDSEEELQWQDGLGAVFHDLDLPIDDPKSTAVAVAIGRVVPTGENAVSPVVAVAHSREELADQIDGLVDAVLQEGDDGDA